MSLIVRIAFVKSTMNTGGVYLVGWEKPAGSGSFGLVGFYQDRKSSRWDVPSYRLPHTSGRNRYLARRVK